MTIPVLNKILYAEDDPNIQKITRLSLEKIGKFEVRVCDSGVEALEAISDYNPDLVLLDVMMPNMDGPTTLKELRNIDRFSATPVIFMTAKAQVHEVQMYKELGVLDIIVKPFNAAELSSQITGLWNKHHEKISQEQQELPQELAEEIEILKQSYLKGLKNKVALLRNLFTNFFNTPSQENLKSFYDELHKLTSSLAMFECTEESELCHGIAVTIKPAISDFSMVNENFISIFNDMYKNLDRLLIKYETV